MKDWFEKNRPLYEMFSKRIEEIISDIFTNENIEYHQVASRTKSLESFNKKLDVKKYKEQSQLTDLSGIRIITYVQDTIPLVRNLIEQHFEIDEQNSADKSIELGIDRVGYKSVHYVCSFKEDRLGLPEFEKFRDCKFEIQIRTILQHSWAEIEHDRNYKFGGKLKDDLQRRLKLLAGLLELADNEFNTISNEIDNYSKEVEEETAKGNLNISIDSTSLQSYIDKLFKDSLVIDYIDNIKQIPEIISELRNYGLETLNQIEDIIPNDLFEAYEKYGREVTSIGVLRDIMIINDSEKYFKKSYMNDWVFFESMYAYDVESAFYKHFGIEKSNLEELRVLSNNGML
ncbi:GTP pyrophosphokinase family protein [Myroides sp. N17-2]|uniref:GTP pyrophosphokinase n=1 Tax=Myroides sp. N17-2 TaxID=2030799 RepID=UPI000EFD6B23|nr:hypothetical protein [Myroides sp. N17-2]